MARGRNLDIAGRKAGGIRWNPALLFDPVFGSVYGNTGLGVYGAIFDPNAADNAFAPTQLTEPWTEYVAASGDIRTVNVLTDPPWQPSASVTLSNPIHNAGDDNIHSDDSANDADAYAGSLTYTGISRDHVDFSKNVLIKVNHQYLFNAFQTGTLNTQIQFALTAAAPRTATIKEGSLKGAAGTTWLFTEDYLKHQFKIKMYGNNSGGAGNIKVEYYRDSALLGSDTVPNSPGESAGSWFSILPHFFSRLGVQVFRLYAVKLQFFTH